MKNSDVLIVQLREDRMIITMKIVMCVVSSVNDLLYTCFLFDFGGGEYGIREL